MTASTLELIRERNALDVELCDLARSQFKLLSTNTDQDSPKRSTASSF
jgi:hypothetical protein